jgi:hypothetical protein
MNRFTVKPGSEPEFEQRWAKRESKLQEARRIAALGPHKLIDIDMI